MDRFTTDRRSFLKGALGGLGAALIAVNRNEITESPHLPSAQAEAFSGNPFREGIVRSLEQLTPPLDLVEDDPWALTRRLSQTPPSGRWRTWLIMAGRGFGKTRTGAEFIREEVMAGRMRRIALVGATAADVRDVMIEGESGLQAVCARYGFPIRYEPSRRRVIFPNGAIATTYSAEEPNRLRGPQHDGFWADEVAAWAYADAWDQLQFGLRLGENPRGIATTTPKPVPVIIDLVDQTRIYYDDEGNPHETDDPELASVRITAGSTYENRDNLAPAFLQQVVRRYEGTRLGDQEIGGLLLLDTVGALWTYGLIDAYRVPFAPRGYDLTRIVVGVDPMVGEPDKKRSRREDSEQSETGIVVAATGPQIDFLTRVLPQHLDGPEHGYVLEDASMSGTPFEWANAVVDAFRRHQADRIIAEANQGGLMVEQTIRQVWPSAPITLVYASRGKKTRAEPVSALYEKGRVHHVGSFKDLEKQMTQYDGTGTSPDRMDALVWAFFDLLVEEEEGELDLATMQHFAWKGARE